MDKLNIRNEMRHLDRKDRDFYHSLTDEERRKFSTYLMIRWSSSVSGPRELQEYYVQACNHYINRDFFAINRHPQLQWLCATAVSPDTGAHDHVWIRGPGRDSGNSAVRRRLKSLYPCMKLSDIDVLSELMDEKEITRIERDHGIGP